MTRAVPWREPNVHTVDNVFEVLEETDLPGIQREGLQIDALGGLYACGATYERRGNTQK